MDLKQELLILYWFVSINEEGGKGGGKYSLLVLGKKVINPKPLNYLQL